MSVPKYRWWGYVLNCCRGYMEDETGREADAVRKALARCSQAEKQFLFLVFSKQQTITQATHSMNISQKNARALYKTFVLMVAHELELI